MSVSNKRGFLADRRGLTINKSLRPYKVKPRGARVLAYLSELNVQTYAIVIAILAAIAYAFVRRRAGGRGVGTLLSMVLNNMTQGVV